MQSIPLTSSPPAASRRSHRATVLLVGLAFIAVLIAAGAFMPKWLTFLLTMAASHGLVSLGITAAAAPGLLGLAERVCLAGVLGWVIAVSLIVRRRSGAGARITPRA